MSKTILVLHGMTMSGASMVRCLGPLASELEQAGFELLAPDAPHQLAEQEVQSFLSWAGPLYERQGRDVKRAFKNGVFWQEGRLYDWLRVETDPATGVVTYHALEKTLDELASLTRERDVVGVIGFSQGAILATLLEALGAQGDERFGPRKFGLYLAGSPPRVQKPLAARYPILSTMPRMLVMGGRDPFFDGEASLEKWAGAFAGQSTLVYDPMLGHAVPSQPESVARLMDFVTTHAG